MSIDSFVNIGLLKHPLNWFTIVFMLIIAGIAFDVIARKFKNPQE